MTLLEFQRFVQTHEAWFMGHAHESYFTLDRVEMTLGVRFPASFRWLLGQYGYWRATGVAALSVIEQMTLSRRPALPAHYVVLAMPSALFFDHFHGRPTHPDDERKLGSVVLKLDETTGDEDDQDDVAVYWVRGPEDKLNGHSDTAGSGRVVRFDNFAAYVQAYCQFQQRHATTTRVANPRGWTADIGHCYTIEEIRGNLSLLLKLLTEVIVCYEHRLTRPARFLARQSQEPGSSAGATAGTPSLGQLSLEEGLFAIQQYRTYELSRSATHVVRHREEDDPDAPLDQPQSARFPPSAWPVVARSSSTWSVPEETRHLHHGRLYLFPVDPHQAPSPALPGLEHWVMLLKHPDTSSCYLLCWLLDGTHRYDRLTRWQEPSAYIRELHRLLTSQNFYCEVEDLVIVPTLDDSLKASA